MASKSEQEHDVAQLNAHFEGDLSVQPIDAGAAVPVDGLILETTGSSSESVASSVEAATSSTAASKVSDHNIDPEKPALQSPFHSAKSSTNSDVSNTAPVDYKIPESPFEHEKTTNAFEEVVEAEEHDHQDDWDRNTLDESVVEATDAAVAKDAVTTNSSVTPASVNPDNYNGIEEVGNVELVDAPETDQEMANSSDPTNNAEDDVAVTDSEEADVKTVVPIPQAQNVPPHLRPGFETHVTRQNGILQDSPKAPQVPPYNEIPRAPRTHQFHSTYQTYRGDGSREELARMGAQLMKTRNELQLERKKSANMRKSVEEEKEGAMDAALSTMTTELLNKQVKMLGHQAKVEAKERDLNFREARIEQLEVYLSEGQKQLHREKIGDDGGLTKAEIDREHGRRQAELLAMKYIAEMEGKVAIRLQGIQLREAAQQMREQQYKALLLSSFLAETKQKITQETDSGIDEVAGIEYNNEFGAGKAAGCAEVEAETRQQGFLEGYSACRQAEILVSKARQGLISCDSPELDFLYDPAHPQNPYTMGTRIGEWQQKQEHGKGKGPTSNVTMKKEPAVENKPEPQLVQKKAEEPVRKLPPPRPTFASELRGVQNMHNGHFVLANGSGPSSPVTTPKANGVNGDNEGRRLLKYEESDEDNLIDLH